MARSPFADVVDSRPGRFLIHLELELIDNGRSVTNSAVNQGLQLLRARSYRHRAERVHQMLILRSCYRLAHQAIEPFNDVRWRARCGAYTHKGEQHERNTKLLQRRDLRTHR